MTNTVLIGDNLLALSAMQTATYQMIYIDPPYNTGKYQQRTTYTTHKTQTGAGPAGYGGNSYLRKAGVIYGYSDSHDDYEEMMYDRLVEAHRVLHQTGTLYCHLDYREVHYVKVMLDSIFGRENFLNEIIWAYDYGARTTKRWPTKHDNILVYVKDIENYYFNSEEVDREPYMAPSLQTPERALRGKLPTDTWWHTIVPTNGKEKTGYPNQKPEGIIKRMVIASTRSNSQDRVLDFFAGSGTTGAVCEALGRSYTLVDSNLEAVVIMKNRLVSAQYEVVPPTGTY